MAGALPQEKFVLSGVSTINAFLGGIVRKNPVREITIFEEGPTHR